jgi:acetyl esterase/lipase
MPLLSLLTAFFGLFGAGRSPATMLNLTVPRFGYRLHRDIAYGEHARNRLDLYLPSDIGGPAPVVLFFYGGAFRAGRKSEYRVVGEALASRGIIAGVADYRLYPEARFPDFLHDGAKALTKLRAIIAEYGGDPNRIFLAGHSAGAYIAVMLAANPAYADPSWIRGVIALSGRYHELPIGDPTFIEIFRGPARAETRPSTFINGKCAPILLAAGGKEDSAVLENMRKLAAHLRAKGSEVEEIVYPGIGHAGIMLALAPGCRHRAPVRADIIRFVATH